MCQFSKVYVLEFEILAPAEGLVALLEFLPKKCRKGGIVQALYAIPTWAFFFAELDFFRGGGLSCFVGNYSYICKAEQ